MEESSFKVFDGFERIGFDSLGLGKGIFEK
jgi:hypothetical protein